MSKMSEEEEFFCSRTSPWWGRGMDLSPYLAPVWAFHLQAAFMGFVFFVGTPLNAGACGHTGGSRSTIFWCVSLGASSTIFSVFVVFISSCYGYFIFGRHVCALEAFLGCTAGTAGEGSWRAGKDPASGWGRGQAVGLEWTAKEDSRGKKFGVLLNAGSREPPGGLGKSQTLYLTLQSTLTLCAFSTPPVFLSACQSRRSCLPHYPPISSQVW